MAINAKPTRHEFWRWLLHECVRANPLYVFSALLLAYAVMQLNAEIDPQVGKAAGAIAVIALLHVYELSVLGVAAVVMIKRPGGGRDMHGLTIVAAIFLGGTFIELDELANSFPAWRFAILAAALALAAFKLECYARLPGVLLPRRYRVAMFAALAVHSLPPLLARCDALNARECALHQGLAWMSGWISLLPMTWLAWRDGRARSENDGDADPLSTRRCGGVAIGIISVLSCVHLISGDWIADRSFDMLRLLPEAFMLAAAAVVLRWRILRALGHWAALLSLAPMLALLIYGSEFVARTSGTDGIGLLGMQAQTCAAAIVFYIALALGTGLKRFYAAPALAFAAMSAEWFGKLRASIPFFRTIVAAFMGFAMLLLGMLLSLHRERLLRGLKTTAEAPDTVDDIAG